MASKGEKKAAAGWYPHPTMAKTQRYWDGEAWTDNIAPKGETGGIEQAQRVAGALNVIKWTLLGLVAVCTVGAAFISVVDAAMLHLGGAGSVVTTIGVLLAGSLYALLVWIGVGLAQHTLAMLALIARNTSRL